MVEDHTLYIYGARGLPYSKRKAQVRKITIDMVVKKLFHTP